MVRTPPRPPQGPRRPLNLPLSQGCGATPIKEAICRRPNRPGSGSSAKKLLLSCGPTPGTALSKAAFLGSRRVGHRPLELFFHCSQRPYEALEVLHDAALHQFRDALPPVGLGHEHAQQLAARDQRLEFARDLIGPDSRASAVHCSRRTWRTGRAPKHPPGRFCPAVPTRAQTPTCGLRPGDFAGWLVSCSLRRCTALSVGLRWP